MSSVRAGLRYVINTGNYETIAVDVMIEDGPRSGEDLSDAFDRVYALVEEKLEAKVNEIVEDLNDQKENK